jgi:hypothetical protein
MIASTAVDHLMGFLKRFRADQKRIRKKSLPASASGKDDNFPVSKFIPAEVLPSEGLFVASELIFSARLYGDAILKSFDLVASPAWSFAGTCVVGLASTT